MWLVLFVIKSQIFLKNKTKIERSSHLYSFSFVIYYFKYLYQHQQQRQRKKIKTLINKSKVIFLCWTLLESHFFFIKKKMKKHSPDRHLYSCKLIHAKVLRKNRLLEILVFVFCFVLFHSCDIWRHISKTVTN